MPGLPQQGRQARAEPARVAGVGAADRVGDADQGHVVLDQRQPQQVVEAELDRVVHHPGDLQRPVLRRHLRHDQVGVHPVEAVVRGEERGDTGDVQRGPGRHRRGRDGRARQPDRRPQRGHVEPAQQLLARPAAPRRQHGRPGPEGEEPPPTGRLNCLVPVLQPVDPHPRLEDRKIWSREICLRVRRPRGRHCGRPPWFHPGGPDQEDHRHGGDRHPDQGGRHVRQAGRRAADDRGHAERAEHRQPRQADPEPANRQHPDHRGEDRELHHDPRQEHVLVVAAEVGDREVLQRYRRQVDRDAADRDHRAAERAGDPGHQLRHPERDRRRQEPGQRAPDREPEHAPDADLVPSDHHGPSSERPDRQIGRTRARGADRTVRPALGDGVGAGGARVRSR